MIKKQIRITYLVELDTDNIEEDIATGKETLERIQIAIYKKGIECRSYVKDFTIDDIENIEEAK